MARPTFLMPGQWALVRSTSGVIAADSTTFTDANFPVASAFDATGYDSVFLCCEIDAGTNPTLTVELMYRDPDALDGQRWKKLLLGVQPGVTAAAAAAITSGALTPGVGSTVIATVVELRTYGHSLVFPRITAVANATSTTAARILALPGAIRPAKALLAQH